MESWFGSFEIFQGILTGIAKKSDTFVIFQGGGGGGVRTPYPPPPPTHTHTGSAHEQQETFDNCSKIFSGPPRERIGTLLQNFQGPRL